MRVFATNVRVSQMSYGLNAFKGGQTGDYRGH